MKKNNMPKLFILRIKDLFDRVRGSPFADTVYKRNIPLVMFIQGAKQKNFILS